MSAEPNVDYYYHVSELGQKMDFARNMWKCHTLPKNFTNHCVRQFSLDVLKIKNLKERYFFAAGRNVLVKFRFQDEIVSHIMKNHFKDIFENWRLLLNEASKTHSYNTFRKVFISSFADAVYSCERELSHELFKAHVNDLNLEAVLNILSYRIAHIQQLRSEHCECDNNLYENKENCKACLFVRSKFNETNIITLHQEQPNAFAVVHLHNCVVEED